MVISWDCFDTLIGRSYVYPRSIFDIISDKTRDTQFTDKRINAEHKAANKNLESIYSLLPNHNPKLEIETEKEYSFPIQENLKKVEDGDIIVSDTYFSEIQILDLLRYHGLNKKVTIYASYGEKANGNIWKKIALRHKIDYHIGDNIYSDIIKPREHGIKTIYYGRSSLNNQEKYIEKYNQYLAYWVRQTRLNNPYFGNNQIYTSVNQSYQYYFSYNWIKENDGIISDDHFEKESNVDENSVLWENRWSDRSRKDNRILWDEQTCFNVPILILVSLGLPKNKQIAFMMRDCFYLHKIYEHLTNKKANIIEASRKSLIEPYNKEYIKYLKNNMLNKTIVDIHGTGNSLCYFCNNHGVVCDKLFVIEHCDFNTKNSRINNFTNCFTNKIKETLYSTRYNHNKKASIKKLKACPGTVLEKFNIPPNMGKLYGWSDNSALRRKTEHNNETADVFSSCVEKCLEISEKYKDKIFYDENLLEDLIIRLYNTKTYTNDTIHSLWD